MLDVIRGLCRSRYFFWVRDNLFIIWGLYYYSEGIEMREKVEEALKTIRPSLQADGGDIELVEVTDDGIVKVRLMGACKGCPMSQMTMTMGVERVLKEQVPGVKKVVAV